jgi:hypothetical protein
MSGELPIAFRLSWQFRNDRPFDQTCRPTQEHKDFQTKAEAEIYRQGVVDRFGDRVAVACITPVYITRTTRERRLRSRQQTVAAAWQPLSRPAESQ